MDANAKNHDLAVRIERRTGRMVTRADAETLRRAEMTLQRWAEGECGNSGDYSSWAIERDEVTGKPYRVTYPHKGGSYRTAIPDREAGALRRIAEVCARLGLYFYRQSDPRGCALYVAETPLDGSNYTNGVACCG